MGHDDDLKATGPVQDESYQYKFVENRVRRSKFVMASIVVAILVLVAVFAVNWYNDRVDCRLDVTVYLMAFPGYEPPEPMEGLEIDLILRKGTFPVNDREVDRVTVRTDGNRIAHGILEARSVGEYIVWTVVFDETRIGHSLDITESDDGETISFDISLKYG